MSDKVYNASITPNRTTPRRYIRVIVYRRDGQVVTPYLWEEVDGKTTVSDVRWQDIQQTATEPEFARAWSRHLSSQTKTQLTLAERRA